MYEVGDFIVYGKNGVCKIDAIGTIDMGDIGSDRMYYTLTPIYSKGSKIFTPVDNGKVVIRDVISKDEAEKLLKEIGELEILTEDNDKQREKIYKETLNKCDCREWAKMVKTLCLRNRDRIQQGKKVMAIDERYLHMAEESLFGELALPLEITKDKVEEYVEDQMNAIA